MVQMEVAALPFASPCHPTNLIALGGAFTSVANLDLMGGGPESSFFKWRENIQRDENGQQF